MDLLPQNVPTTDNQGTSKAIVILLMSLHSKASQQPPSAELILSPLPQNLHLSPGSILFWYLVGSCSHVTCSPSLCLQGQELFKRARNSRNRGPNGVNRLKCTSKVRGLLEPAAKKINDAPATDLANKPQGHFILTVFFCIMKGLYIDHKKYLR